MKQIAGLTLILALWMSLSGFLRVGAQQADESGQPVKLEGVISDSMCGARHMMSGDEAKCTRTCVSDGSHYVLLTQPLQLRTCSGFFAMNFIAKSRVSLVAV
jgi:hypothetical protein